jgi:hypothetical protein
VKERIETLKPEAVRLAIRPERVLLTSSPELKLGDSFRRLAPPSGCRSPL